MTRRASEVAFAAVLAVAVGGGTLDVQPQAANLFAARKVGRPDVETARQRLVERLAHVVVACDRNGRANAQLELCGGIAVQTALEAGNGSQ
eukprot:6186709-Pleurochrysis_carterae.AAC.5